MRLGRWQTPQYLCSVLLLLVILPQRRSTTLGLPLSTTALNPGASQSTSTDQQEVQALSYISSGLFQTTAQEVAYGWLQDLDPCGTATCSNDTTPACMWTGLSCENWHVTAIQLDPVTIRQPGMSAQLGGTISPYFYYLARLRSLKLADQGLTGTVPRVLSELGELQVLDLSSNVLTGFLPNVYSLLTNLTTLRLNNNSLEGQVPPVWSAMANLTMLDLRNNSAICNPLPNIPHLVNPLTNTTTNPNLQFPACNASILAAQAAAAGDAPPSPTPSTSPSPVPAAVSPVSQYRMSQGINVSVSVLVGICFLLGLCAGVVRIRQQRRNHQRLLAGLNRARQNQYDPNFPLGSAGGSPEGIWPEIAPYAAADYPYCSTPRLVLGPDGQQLALARKLKHQVSREAQEAGQQLPAPAGASNPGASEPNNTMSPLQPHINLYTAVLDMDALQTTVPAAPLDLVSPAAAALASPSASVPVTDHAQGNMRPSSLDAAQYDVSSSRQAGGDVQPVSSSASPASPGSGFLSRISRRVPGLATSSAAHVSTSQHPANPIQSSEASQDVEASSAVDGSRPSTLQSDAPAQEQGSSRLLPARRRWPFNRVA